MSEIYLEKSYEEHVLPVIESMDTIAKGLIAGYLKYGKEFNKYIENYGEKLNDYLYNLGKLYI